MKSETDTRSATETKNTLESALLHLNDICDGSVSNDSHGFNKDDAKYLKPRAQKLITTGILEDRKDTLRRMKKYARTQLLPAGFDFQKIIEREQLSDPSLDVSEGNNVKDEIFHAIDLLLEDGSYATVTETQEILHYEGGVFRPGGEKLLTKWLEEKFGNDLTTYLVNESLAKVRRKTAMNLSEFDVNLDMINVKNGMLNMKTRELVPHDPKKYPSLKQLAAEYRPDASCHRIRQFFGEILHGEDVPLIEEMFGFLLMSGYPIHKAFMLYGSGRNGKGTLLRLVEELLGINNVSHVSLSQLGNRFSAAEIVGKMANINGDISQKDLESTETFKQLTGGDHIQLEKKYLPPFDYINGAKMIFASNKLPRSTDDTTGYYSRWIIINFDKTVSTPNPNLSKELSIPDELSGLLNMALNGYDRLVKNNCVFSYDKTIDEVRAMYLMCSDPVVAFLINCCELSADEHVERNALYKAYQEYATRASIPVYSNKKFAKHLQEQNIMPVGTMQPALGNGSRPRVWTGLRLRPA